jgi:ADP-ribose pyrophosphatase YjhB (NUDIX family)
MDGYIKKLREKVGNDKIIINFVAACIVDENNCVLLQKRGDEGHVGKWGLPGGAIEINESLEEGLRREVLEETGLEIDIDRLVGVYSKYFSKYPNGDESQTIVTLFLCHPRTGSLTSDGKETIDLRFFDKEKMPELFNQQHKDMVNDCMNGLFGIYR